MSPNWPLIFKPQENISPVDVKQRVCPKPPAAFITFWSTPSFKLNLHQFEDLQVEELALLFFYRILFDHILLNPSNRLYVNYRLQ